MKKLAYAVICSTGLIVSAFAPKSEDRSAGVFFACTFGIACIITNEPK